MEGFAMSTLHSNICAVETDKEYLLIDQMATGRTDIRALMGRHGDGAGMELYMTRDQLAQLHVSLGKFLKGASDYGR
jgi:hypothetical protein